MVDGYEDNNRISDFWYCMKAIAIFSVLSAHSDYVVNSEDQWYFVAKAVFDCFGRIGVPIFFIASGYYFKIGNGVKGFCTFWKNKTIKIVIPWMIWGTIVWLYIVLRKGDATLSNWFYYVVNGGSYLWYMKTLMVIYLLASLLKEGATKILGLVVVVLNVSKFLIDIVPSTEIAGVSTLWISYFAFGLFLREHENWTLNELERVRIIGWVALLGIIVLFCYETSLGNTFAYFGFFNTINIFLWFMLSVDICGRIMRVESLRAISIDVGKCSYHIYLIHMLLAGVCNAITNIERFKHFIYLRPLVVLGGDIRFC